MNLSSLPGRVYFLVRPHGRNWDVCVEQQPPIPFQDRATAITAAMAGARKIWEEFRQCSGVRIQDEFGWHVMQTYGSC